MKIRSSDYQIAPEELTVDVDIPRYHVLLHNDDVNSMDFVTNCLMQVFGFTQEQAWAVMYEAHTKEVALCATEPYEAAEFHRDRLIAFGLLSTIEEESGS